MKTVDKFKAFMEKYTREKYFQDRVLLIRGYMKIPPEGDPFSLTKKIKTDPTYYDYIFLSTGIFYKEKRFNDLSKEQQMPYYEIISKLPTPYKTHTSILFINAYIQYNEKPYFLFKERDYFKNDLSVSVHDLRNAYLEMKDCCDCNLKVAEDFLKNTSAQFPVIIEISPYATQREVISLVTEQWDYIKEIMNDHIKNKEIKFDPEAVKELRKIRKRKKLSLEIEDVIYRHKEKTLTEVAKIVKKKTGKSIQYDEVGKIKSLAIQRRENRK